MPSKWSAWSSRKRDGRRASGKVILPDRYFTSEAPIHLAHGEADDQYSAEPEHTSAHIVRQHLKRLGRSGCVENLNRPTPIADRGKPTISVGGELVSLQ